MLAQSNMEKGPSRSFVDRQVAGVYGFSAIRQLGDDGLLSLRPRWRINSVWSSRIVLNPTISGRMPKERKWLLATIPPGTDTYSINVRAERIWILGDYELLIVRNMRWRRNHRTPYRKVKGHNSGILHRSIKLSVTRPESRSGADERAENQYVSGAPDYVWLQLQVQWLRYNMDNTEYIER